jgi:hypothetical protein
MNDRTFRWLSLSRRAYLGRRAVAKAWTQVAASMLAATALAASPAPAPAAAPLANKAAAKAPEAKAPEAKAPEAKAPEAKAAAWGKLTSADGAQTFELRGAEVLVGTEEICQVKLTDKTVAGQHARLSYRDGVIEVHDLGSRGGTLVAGTAVKPGKAFRILQPVELTFGAASLNFAFGERPDLIGPTQKARQAKTPAAASKSAPAKAAPAKPAKNR